MNISETCKADIEKAIAILKEQGCTEIFIFGSAANGDFHSGSDIDIAVKGCPPGKYFSVLAALMMNLEHKVDLIDLDSQVRFGSFLQNNGELQRVA